MDNIRNTMAAIKRIQRAGETSPFSPNLQGKRAAGAEDWQRRYNLLRKQDSVYNAMQDRRKRNDRMIGREIDTAGGLTKMRETQIFGTPFTATDRPGTVDQIRRVPTVKTAQQLRGAIDANFNGKMQRQFDADTAAWQQQEAREKKAVEIEKANRILNDHPGMMGDIIARTGYQTLEENAPLIVQEYEKGLAERNAAGQLSDTDRYYMQDVGSWEQPAAGVNLAGKKPTGVPAAMQMAMRIQATAEEARKNAKAMNPEAFAKYAKERALSAYNAENAAKLDPTTEADYRIWRDNMTAASRKRIDTLMDYEEALEYTGQADKLPAVRAKLAQEIKTQQALEKLKPEEFYWLQQDKTAEQYERTAAENGALQGRTDEALAAVLEEEKKQAIYKAALKGAASKEMDLLQELTQEEKDTYLYWRERDREKANRYLEAITPRINARATARTTAEAEEFADKYPLLAAPLSWVDGPIASAATLLGTAGQGVKNLVTGKEIPVDYNAPVYRQQAALSGINEGLVKGHEGAARFGIEALNSVGQNLSALATGPAALPVMGLTAAGQSTYDALQRGAGAGKALGYGLTSGGIEMATEYLPTKGLQRAISPIGKVAGETTAKRLGKAGLNALSQAATEGVEEGVGAIGENIADAVIMQDLSKRNLFIDAAIQNGATEEEAKAAANKMVINDILYSAAQGAASGGLLGGFAEGVGMHRADAQGRKLLQNGDIDVLVEAAEILGQDSKSYQIAEKMLQQENISSQNAADLQETVAEELLQNPEAMQAWGKEMGISKEAAKEFALSNGMEAESAELFAEGFEEKATAKVQEEEAAALMRKSEENAAELQQEEAADRAVLHNTEQVENMPPELEEVEAEPQREKNHIDELMELNPIADGVGAGNATTLRMHMDEVKRVRRGVAKFSRDYDVTQLERDMAKLVIKGTVKLNDLPQGARPKIVAELAKNQAYLQELQRFGTSTMRRKNMQREMIKAKELIGGMDKPQVKEIMKLRRLTPERVMRVTFGMKTGQKMINYYIRPMQVNESNRVQFVNNVFDEARKLDLNEEERALTQIVGEKKITLEGIRRGELAEALEGSGINDKEIIKIIKNVNKADLSKVEKAVKWYRQTYDDMFDIINDFRARHGLKPVEKRKNYFPHFEKLDDATKMLRDFGIQGVSDLPTEIAGLTADFKPSSRWVANFERREGRRTSFDAAEGLQIYMTAVSDMLYHTDDVMRLRALDAVIRGKADKKTKEDEIYNVLSDDINLAADDAITIDDVNAIMEGKYGNAAAPDEYSGFAVWLTEMANNMANKQQTADRATEHQVSRTALNMVSKAAAQFGKNSVVGNISSALNNTITFPKIFATTQQKYVLRAMKEIGTGEFEKKGLAKQSEFLQGKVGVDLLVKSKSQELADKVMQYTFEPVEKFVSESAFYAKYLESIDKGMSEQAAIKKANLYAAQMMSRRSKESLPLKMLAKNPFEKLTSMFQVELSNDWYSLRQDLPAWLRKVEKTQGKEQATKLLAAGVAKYCAYSFALNSVLQAITGFAPAPDPIRWAEEALQELLNPDDENAKWYDRIFGALQSLGENAIQVVPEVSAVMALIGKGNGRIPLPAFDVERIANGVDAIVRGEDANAVEYGKEQLTKGLVWPLVMLTLPFGGNQLKKTVEGAGTVAAGKMVRQSKEGEQLMTGVERTPLNAIRAGLFGRSALKEVNEYWDENKRPLSVKQTQQAYEAQEQGVELNQYREYLEERKDQQAADDGKGKKKSSMEITADALKSMENLTDEQRALLFSMQHESAEPYQNPFLPNYNPDVAEMSKERYEIAKALQKSNRIPIPVYQEVYDYYSSISGENKKNQMMEYIESLELDREQKTALFSSYYTDIKDYTKAAELYDQYGIPAGIYMEMKKYNSSLRGKKADKRRKFILEIDKLPLENNQKDALLLAFFPEG